jgi:anaerobic ribonucleoside-triphosphate reductase activating protein
MYLCGVNFESMVDGEGVRAVLFVSGCLHNCPYCHSPQTHSFTFGREVNQELIDNINSEMDKRPYISGITLSGGDCMYSPVETMKLLKKLHIPHNNVWCYTGFTYEEIINNKNQAQLLRYVDVLVDGKFDYRKRDITLAFKGSTNQRIIDVKKSLKYNEVKLYELRG